MMIPSFLFSYHYYKNKNLDELIKTIPGSRIFIDSGAFSAYTQGAAIDIDAYIDYLIENKGNFEVACSLDVINDPEASWKNWQHMRTRGVEATPVFHTGADLSLLDRYASESDYICLGKLVPYAKTPEITMPWIEQAFAIVAGRAKIHGLGVTNWSLLSRFPWDSVDSSAWGAGFRFGSIQVFTGNGFSNVKLGEPKHWSRVAKHVSRYGYDWRRFATRKSERREHAGLAAISFKSAERYLAEQHDKPGFVIYLADSTMLNIQMAYDAIQKYKENNSYE